MKLDVYSEIRKNKVKTGIMIFIFLLFLGLIGYVFGAYFGIGYFGIPIAVTLAVLIALVQYYRGDKLVLKISKARPVTKAEYPHLFHTVEGLAIAAGVPTPKMYVIDDTAPNAFATGRDPEHSSVAVTTGLLQKMNRQELEGVIAHEMSHIKNYDIRIATLVVVMVGVIVLMSDFILRSFLWGGGRRRHSKEGGIIIAIGLVLAVLAPLIAVLIKLSISRKREYLADVSGAMLTRYPEGLASALEKLDKDNEPLEVANKATENLYIVNPLKNLRGRLNGLFSTHPPIEERVKRLRAM